MNNSLTYDSLRTVLQHMDANLRFRLAARIPSIRAAEKATPLKIESLVYKYGSFSINNLTYSLSLYLKSKNGETPEHIQEYNENRMHCADIDQYGFGDGSGRILGLPGDIVFRDNYPDGIVVNEASRGEEDMRRIEAIVEEKLVRLEKLMEMAPPANEDGDPFGEDVTSIEANVFAEHLQIFRTGPRYAEITQEQLKIPAVEAARRLALREIEMEIMKEMEDLQRFYNRRDNIPYQFDIFIQLIIGSQKNYIEIDVHSIERVEYTAKLHEARKNLGNFLFGNRKHSVDIKRLEVDYEQIMRLPVGLKIRIRELSLNHTVAHMYERLEPILESNPLEVLEICNGPGIIQDYMHPVARMAKKLIISADFVEEGSWLPIYLQLQNKNVHKERDGQFSNQDYIGLIRSWLEKKKENGTSFTFKMQNEKTITELLKMIPDQLDAVVPGVKYVIIPINELSSVKRVKLQGMTQNKPLTYDSLRTVLQHMDANFRFRLASHIPSIRSAEKSAPLKIENLMYNGSPFFINNLQYSISIYRKHKTKKTPERVQCNNKYGFLCSDIDKYGFHDKSWRGIKLPGDVAFQKTFRQEVVLNQAEQDEEDMLRMERRLRRKEIRLAKLLTMAPTVIHEIRRPLAQPEIFNQYLRVFERGRGYADVTQEQLDQPEIESARKLAVQFLESTINNIKSNLEPLHNRRDNVEYPYDIYIQLLAFRNDIFSKAEKVERVEYTTKILQAEKYLFNWLFGNRKPIVFVKHLTVCEHITLRVPFGLKLKIRELTIRGNFIKMYKSLKQIVDDSSYPLETLKISGGKRIDQDYDHLVIRSARRLIIDHKLPEELRWLPIYEKLQNPIVHKLNGNGFAKEDYVRLVQNWLENEKEIGTCYTFRMREEKTVTEILELIKEQFDDAISEENCVAIPMNSLSNVKVSCEAEQGLFEDEKLEAMCSSWILRMVVVSIEPDVL